MGLLVFIVVTSLCVVLIAVAIDVVTATWADRKAHNAINSYNECPFYLQTKTELRSEPVSRGRHARR